MTLEKILDFTISYQDNARSRNLKTITVRESLRLIKEGRFSSEIAFLRKFIENNELDHYKANKTKLPAVTFSANFSEARNRSTIDNYNCLLVLDIDGLDNDQMIVTKAKLLKDEHVLAFWVSPSKAGVKGLIYLNYDLNFSDKKINTSHTFAFRCAKEYFLDNLGIQLDGSGSDITRLCFFSHDEDLFLRPYLKPFTVVYDNDKFRQDSAKLVRENLNLDVKFLRNKMYNPYNRNKPQDRITMNSITKYLQKNKKSITYDYYHWFQVAMAITTTFTYELGSKMFQTLSKMDESKYNADNCKEMLEYCYNYSDGSFKFGTIVHFAQEAGYKKRKEVPKVEFLL